MNDHAEWEDPQSEESAVKRLIAFFRSVIPQDPTQLLFLTGAILLLVAPRASWRPDALVHGVTVNYWEVYGYTAVGSIVVLAAGLMALCACFWRLRNPLRAVFWGVLVTGLLGLLFLLWKFFELLVGAQQSVLDTHNNVWAMIAWVKLNLHNFPTGFYTFALGLALLFVYFSRMAFQVSFLPLALSNVNTSDVEEAEVWSRDRLVLFFLIGIFGSLANLAYLLATLVWKLPWISVRGGLAEYVFGLASALLNAGILLGISLYILGRRGRTSALLSLRMPERQSVALAFLLPAAAYALLPAGHFIFDRIHWAAHEFGRFHPPILSLYFDVSQLGRPWVVFLVFAAFAEEIIFRGVLLPDFIRRYGVHRGIFLTGIGWAAIHFRSDSYTGLSLPGVFLSLLMRVVFCLGMNYVLAWMVLRWKSVIPAGITHTVWNMVVFSSVSDSAETRYFDCGLWLMIAFFLFRFWPVAEEAKGAGVEAPNLEPAV